MWVFTVLPQLQHLVVFYLAVLQAKMEMQSRTKNGRCKTKEENVTDLLSGHKKVST